jgi:hypothetical protein
VHLSTLDAKSGAKILEFLKINQEKDYFFVTLRKNMELD